MKVYLLWESGHDGSVLLGAFSHRDLAEAGRRKAIRVREPWAGRPSRFDSDDLYIDDIEVDNPENPHLV